MIDLRSDTLSMPDRKMLETILDAPLGDDGRTDSEGRGEDATINRLEDMAAEMVGKEAAILAPTGTFGNSMAIMSLCKPGDKVLVEEEQHILLTEKFVFDPAFGQLQPVIYHLDKSHMPDPAEIAHLLDQSGAKLLCLENTHNFSGGYCIDVPTMAAIYEQAHSRGVHVHLDGARLFHAAASLGVSVKDICQYTDSVMFCVSKGLGAPVGSLLCGSREFCANARRTRKLLGGVTRQGGVIAAPAIYALQHNVERLSEDIDNTRLIHSMLCGKLNNISLQEQVQTNILVLHLPEDGVGADVFCERAKDKGLLIRPVRTNHRVRLVLYKGITREDAIGAAEIILALDKELY